MKIKISFSSIDEFADFILSASSIGFDMGYKSFKVGISQYDCWEFWNSISNISVTDTKYSIRCINSEPQRQRVAVEIINYMLNEAQIRNGAIFIHHPNGEALGPKEVKGFLLTNLPNSFILRVGWRTDYSEYLFTKV